MNRIRFLDYLAITTCITIAVFSVACAQLTAFNSGVSADLSKANAWLASPTNQADIQTAAKVLAAGIAIASPYVTGSTASAAVSAAAVVANAYSNNVPSSILQATTQSLSIAKQVAPLVTNGSNLTTTNKILASAAQLLNSGAITPANAASTLQSAGIPATTGT
jgi:hypothetical protein